MTDTAKIESIGERLHKARLKKKVSIDEAYKDIKIHPKVLLALEEDRYEEFLSSIYIKAFLKTYCRYLELDAHKIIADYEALNPRKSTEGQRQKFDIGSDDQHAQAAGQGGETLMSSVRRWLVPGLGAAAVVIAAVLVIFFAVKAAGRIKFTRKTPVKTAANAVSGAEIPSGRSLALEEAEPLKLIIKAKGSVWMQIRADGEIIFQNVLKKGSVEVYTAQKKFQLWIGKGELVELTLNGHSLGSPGNGTLKSLLITHEGLHTSST